MGTFIMICVGIVGCFAAALIISTLCMGTSILLSLQVLMGSLKYNKEVDDKLNLVLGKIDAGFYHVVVDECTISLYSKEQYPDTEIPFRATPEIEIWIANKFYSYGNIYRTLSQSRQEIKKYRPSIKVIKQIYHLEKTNGASTKKVKKEKPSKKTEKVVLE